MFYSHTFLAKKSPLGTVWIAAHLQHKLRKSHVAVTDISSTVDCIIFPEVPIALRLSGHLLLGIVRIYSKKVDYLYHECNDVLSQVRTMFASVHVNLPADADRATFQAVTLPDTFELDALDLGLVNDEAPDTHLKTFEQITLPDQIPGEGDPYVAFIISEERFDSSPHPESRSTSSEPIDETNLHKNHEGSPRSVSPSHGPEIPQQNADMDFTPVSISPIEVARNAVPEGDFVELENAILGLNDSGIQMKEGAVSSSPATGLLPVSGEDSLPILREMSPVLPSLHASAAPDSGIKARSVELELRPSPPVKIEKKRTRKRKQLFDASLVLPNREMKRQLEDTGGIMRKRRRLPCSYADLRMCLRNMDKENMFKHSLLSGICTKLQELTERSIPQLVCDSSPGNVDHMEEEIERARDATGQYETVLESTPIPTEREEIPASLENFDHRDEISPSSMAELFLEEMDGSPEDLVFLDEESTASAQGNSDISSMSTRTRLVAHFFKEQSPQSQFSNGKPRQINLTSILQGKMKKQCARMFFETLVLKSCDLVDVEQDQAYGEIWVSLKPGLSKLAI
ncbi:rad21/Rec8-like family protein isoform X2 [Wolffia australiana]